MGIFPFKIKKIKRRNLYKSYLNKRNIYKTENKVEDAKASDSMVTNISISAKERADNPLKRNIPYTVAIAALDDKCGCTYITKALYKYIHSEKNRSVCIIDFAGLNNEYNSGFEVYSLVDICNLYDDFDYILLDVGNLYSINENEKGEFKRANKKIIVSKFDDYYLRKIYNEIKQDKDSVLKWEFVFNQIAPGEVGKVKALMENYKHYCLPNFYITSIDKTTKKIFKNIIE
jgi:hypothetical protein